MISVLNAKKKEKQKEKQDNVTLRKRVFGRKGASRAKQNGVC